MRRDEDRDCAVCWQGDCDCTCATCEAARQQRAQTAEAWAAQLADPSAEGKRQRERMWESLKDAMKDLPCVWKPTDRW